MQSWNLDPALVVVACGLVLTVGIILSCLATGGIFPSIARLSLLAAWASMLCLAVAFTAITHEELPWSWIVLLPFAALLRPALTKAGWTHGSARWAKVSDLAAGGYLNNHGVLLGKTDSPSPFNALRQLWTAPWSASSAACQLFFAALTRRGVWVTSSRHVHTLVVAPPGAGKSQSFVIPQLLSCPDTVIALDVKGELTKATAKRRKRLGHNVYVFDPFSVTGVESATLNLLDCIDRDSPTAVDDIKAFAADLIVTTGKEAELHWNASAEHLIAAVSCFVVGMLPPDDRNMQVVVAIISNPHALQTAIQAMRDAKDLWSGILARMGDQLCHLKDKELASVITTALRHLNFLNSPLMVAHTTKSSLNPRTLINPKTTAYFVVPPDKLQSHSGLLRAFFGSVTRLIAQTGLKNRAIHVVLEEAAAIGRCESIENAVPQLRGSGARFTFIYQARKQVSKGFPEQEETFFANMGLQVYFGLNDYESAKHVSEMIGAQTVLSNSSSGGWNSGTSQDGHGMSSISSGRNGGWSTSEAARELLKPEEILRLGDRRAIVFAPGIPPLMTRLVRAYESEFRFRHNSSSLALAFKSASIATMCIVVTVFSIRALEDRRRTLTGVNHAPERTAERPTGKERVGEIPPMAKTKHPGTPVLRRGTQGTVPARPRGSAQRPIPGQLDP